MRKNPDYTNDNSANNKLHKLKLEREGKIHCGLCPYNKGENTKRQPRKSWKKNKKRNQFD